MDRVIDRRQDLVKGRGARFERIGEAKEFVASPGGHERPASGKEGACALC